MALRSEELAKLIIKIQTDVNDLKKGLDQGKSRVSEFGNMVKRIFAGIGFALVTKKITGLVKESIDLMDTMAKTAQKVGVATETLSGLKYAAEISGVQFGTLSTGLRLFAKNMYDASNGIGEAKDAFADLGVSVTDSDGNLKSVNTLLAEVADKMKGLENETQKTAIAQRIFGRSGSELIPLLNQGSSGIRRLMEEAKRLGIVIDTDTARAAEDLNDNLRALREAVNGLFMSLAKDLLPGLVDTTNAMKEFVIENRTLLSLPFKAIAEVAKNFREIAIALTAVTIIKFAPIIYGWVMALGSLKIAIDASVTSLGVFKTFLVALIGLKIGEWLGGLIDKFTYLTTGLDISGMNRIKEVLAGQKEEAGFLAEKLEGVNKKLAALGFTGPDAMQKFKDAVKAGNVEFDKTSGTWKRVKKDTEDTGKTMTSTANVMEKLKSKARELQLQFIALTDPVRAAEMALEDFIRQTTEGHPERFAGAVNQLRDAFKRLSEEQQKQALAGVESEERLSQAMIKVQDAMQQVEQNYEAGLISISEYYDQKRVLVEQSSQAEVAAINDQIAASKNEIDQRRLGIQAAEKQAESRRQIMQLNHEEAQSTRDFIESINELRTVQERGFKGRGTEGIAARYDTEIVALEERYATAIEKVKELDNERLAAIEEGLTKEQILKDLCAAKDLQRAQLNSQKELELRRAHYRQMSDMYEGMSDVMGDLYAASGSKMRVFFELQQKFSMAAAMMNAHEAATKAMAQGGIWGMIQAGAIYAKAIAHAMAIGAQMPEGFAEGGLITKGSGTKDDVLIRGKKNEYVMPVKTTRYYGLEIMDMLKNLMIPKDAFSFATNVRTLVPSLGSTGGSLTINVPVSVEQGSGLARRLKDAIETTVLRVIEERI